MTLPRGTGPPRVGLAVSTVGRRGLQELLDSAARSLLPPHVVAVANQSGHALDLTSAHLPFDLRMVDSRGGASAGRNDAVKLLGDDVDLVGFPNDDSALPRGTLSQVVACWTAHGRPAAVTASLSEPAGRRFQLPPSGAQLDRRSVWRAIEPATFLSLTSLKAVGGFRTDLGTGCAAPWQSGEGTDVLLRMLEAGMVLVSCPEAEVTGPGERRTLTPDELVAKHRGYARGTGYVYRLHRYPSRARIRILLAPWSQLLKHDDSARLSVRIAWARSLGRAEGLLARSAGPDGPRWSLR